MPARETKASQERYAVSEDGKTIRASTGEEVKIQKIDAIQDGKMTFRLEDGSTVDAADIAYASQGEALIYETVAGMGVNTDAANVLVDAFSTSREVSAEYYAEGIREAYQYGTYHYPMQDVANGPFSSMLTEYQRNAAYQLGQLFGSEQAAREQAAVKEKAASKDASGNSGGVHFDGDQNSLNARQKTSLSALETIADVLGVQIYVFESPVNEKGKHIGENGWYDTTDGSFHIDLYAGTSGMDTMLFTAAHELTHFIRQWSPTKFKELSGFLMKEYGKQNVSVETLVQDQIRKADKDGRTISYDTAYEEVIADSMETMLSDGKVVEKLAKKHADIWQKMKDFIHDLAEKIRKAYAGLKPDSKEGRLVAEMKDAVEQLQTLFTEGLEDAGRNYQGIAAKENATGAGGDVKYSINRDFAKKFDAWDKKSRFQFLIGTTSDALKSIGVDEKRIYWDASKIKKIQDKHPQMTDSIIKQVPNILENPVLVMESQTVVGRLTLFGEVYDAAGVPVVAVLELNPTDKNGHSLDIIKIASAYGKNVNLQGFIDNSKILYTNKERIESWLSENRLKLPLPSSSFDSSVTSIRRSSQNVKEKSAVQNAGENYQAAGKQKNTAQEGSVRYSLREYSEHQKKNWEASKRIVVYNDAEQLAKFIQDSITNKTMDKKCILVRFRLILQPEFAMILA